MSQTETRYFIRKPNGMLIQDADEAQKLYSRAHSWHPNAWSLGFILRHYAETLAEREFGQGFAVVPRICLAGRDE